jgi:hypothetical protein
MVGSLINICHALSKLSLFFGWEKSKMSVDPIPEPGWYENIGEGPEYRPFRDLRSVPKAGRLRE